MGNAKIHSANDLADYSTRRSTIALSKSEKDQIARAIWAGQPASEVALQFGITRATVDRLMRQMGR